MSCLRSLVLPGPFPGWSSGTAARVRRPGQRAVLIAGDGWNAGRSGVSCCRWFRRVGGIGKDHDAGGELRSGLDEAAAQSRELGAGIGVVRGRHERVHGVAEAGSGPDMRGVSGVPG